MQLLGPHPPRLPVGLSDYAQLRRGGYTYVDKTPFVAQVIDGGALVQLHPRPRRFGKTLNLSTVRHFLERPARLSTPASPGGPADLTDVFADTEIWHLEGGRFRAHFQRYPVIWLTFKDVKLHTWPEAWSAIRQILQDELRRLQRRCDLDQHLDAASHLLLDEALAPLASPDVLNRLLARLSRWCAEATGEPVVILIDEYDAALLAAWQYGYWEEAISFFRTFLSAGLKDNPHLFRGALTGILRVAKEGIFSGLNNVRTFGLLTPGPAATAFGFTEPEVEALAGACGQAHQLAEIRHWYNGYRFGGLVPHTLYNPWSLLEYLANPSAGFQSFWKNTSANDLIHELLVRFADVVGTDVAALLAGETVQKLIDDTVSLPQIYQQGEVLWSLLLFSGYLTAESSKPTRNGYEVAVRLPNEEVRAVYEDTFVALLRRFGSPGWQPRLTRALLTGDGEALQLDLERLLQGMLSHHDLWAHPVEAVYQAFIVGLLVTLEPTHRVTSNREAGHGRADVLIAPRLPGGAGAVLELKVVHPRQTSEAALAAAVAQLRARCYHTEVQAAGAAVVHQYAVVFDGKRCWVEPVPNEGPIEG